jgi:hypothetical protein
MMQAYVDESGGKGQTKTFVFSALIGDTEEWAQKSDEWDSVLKETPRIAYFKMDEAEGLSGQFFGLSHIERDIKLKRLCSVLRVPSIRTLSVTVDIADFLRIWAPRLGRPASEPYFFPFQAIHAAIAYDLLSQGQTEHCEIFFDENKIFGPRAKVWYPVIRHGFLPEIQGILPVEPFFRDDKEILPLQAADLTAWIQRTYSCKGSLGNFEWLYEELRGMGISPFSRVFDAKWFTVMASDKAEANDDAPNRVDIAKVYKDAFGFEWPPKNKEQKKRHAGR